MPRDEDKCGQIKHLRRRYQKLRKQLQKANKRKVIKRLESKERRIITYINHCISKQLVQFAKDYGMGLRFEDLPKIRQTLKQSQLVRSDARNNRHAWSYFQLETLTRYKAIKNGVPFQRIKRESPRSGTAWGGRACNLRGSMPRKSPIIENSWV